MARKFGPFDTSQFYEVENRRLQRAFNQSTGFVKTGQGAVTAGTGAQLVIAAYPDGALIDGMYVENPSSETVTVSTNTGSGNTRIDRLVLRLDMDAKTITPFQIVGTPASSPSAPPLVNTGTVVDLPLCRFTMPGNGSPQNPGSIVSERITLPGPNWIPVTGYAPNTVFPGGGAEQPVAVSRSSNGKVDTRGVAYAGNGVGAGTVLFQIPVGYWPSWDRVIMADLLSPTDNTSLTPRRVRTNWRVNGTVDIQRGLNGEEGAYICFDDHGYAI